MDKKILRNKVRQLKSLCTSTQLAQMSIYAIKKLKLNTHFQTARTICLYNSLPDEVDTAMLLAKALLMGKRVLLPKVVGDELELRIHTPGSLLSGAYGIMEPTGELFPVESYHEIDLAIIPGVAFDRLGARLGRGKGYYDRLLSQMPNAYKIGICFPFQLLERLPSEPHDVLMNEVI